MSGIEAYLTQMTNFRAMRMDLVDGNVKAQPIPKPNGFEYYCIEDFVMQNGHVFSSEELTDEEAEIVKAAIEQAQSVGWEVHTMKQCYSNAQLVVLSDRSGQLHYAEGYAVGLASIAVQHGWVTINGKVVDVTWKLDEPTSRNLLPDHPVGELPEGYEYFGFVMENRGYIRNRIMYREIVGSLLDDWEANYPLLRGVDPHDEESFAEFEEYVEERYEEDEDEDEDDR